MQNNNNVMEDKYGHVSRSITVHVAGGIVGGEMSGVAPAAIPDLPP